LFWHRGLTFLEWKVGVGENLVRTFGI
jgi:hypothetical protein